MSEKCLNRLTRLRARRRDVPIVTAKMNDIDPQAWLADILARIAEHPVQKLDKLPWNWRGSSAQIRRAG